MKRFLKKYIFLLSVLLFTPLYGQQILNDLNTSWQNVLPGIVITEPALTSYGFCLITDARLLTAFSNEGVQLWEKPVARSRNLILSSLPGDFISLIDNNSKTIKILNPSGGEIWSKKLDYTVTNPPFAGRDGRFFLKGENILECYGMNGVCKFSLETENQKKMSPQELPDGSLILFVSELAGKTRGLRISPFGEILEEILFAGEITNSFTCDDGVLLTFTDGSSGLFTVNNGLSQNKWTVQKKSSAPYFSVSQDGTDYLFLEFLADGLQVNQLDKRNGQITTSMKIQGINTSKIKKISYNKNGLFISDNKSACLYNTNGNELWSANLPYSKSRELWNYLLYTSSNYLVFCFNDWSINAYHIAQNKDKTIQEKTFSKSYNEYIKPDSYNFSIVYTHSFDAEMISQERLEKLQTGFYGQKEEDWASEILSVCLLYAQNLSQNEFGTRTEVSVFEEDSRGFANILEGLLSLGNIDAQNCAASILSKTPNKSFQKIILNGIAKNGYDPDQRLLDSLEVYASKINNKETLMINSICDAVYSICLFMGRPAYNTKGKDIIKKFLYPNYNSKTRQYARDTLKKIMELEL